MRPMTLSVLATSFGFIRLEPKHTQDGHMKSGLNVDYINPFIESVVNTFKTMASVDTERERVFLKGEGTKCTG